ncbi:MAG: hypothetical protein QOJ20_3154 [Mycobacterium sp.]|nr:hypothetical protein [Mycobacterium sp.]
MSAPFEICSKRSVVAVLASGVVISLTALTGGITPAFAKPDTDQVVTTTAPAPEPKVQAPEEIEAPPQQAPPKAPAPVAVAPSVESPPQTQQVVEPPPPPVTQSTVAPVVTPVAPATPTTVNPPVTKVESPAPRVVAPPASEPVSEPPSVTSTAAKQSPATQTSSVPSAPVATSASPTASVGSAPPSAALVAPSSAMGDMPPPSTSPVTPSSGSATPGSESKASEPTVSAAQSSSAATTGGSTLSISEAAKVIETSEPQTLQAPKGDIELASNAKPVEVKADPAPKQDVDAIASSIGLDLGMKGPLGVDASAKADARLASDRVRDRDIRQWSPDWVQYDEYYRPILLNPYRERVRIVYIYDYAPRIVWIPPLARIILDVAQFSAYSFTAVVDTAANLVNAAAQTAVNVAVGSFFGGGYVPAFGLPLPPPPPRVLRYDNVPVQVRYSNATYEPFRVRRIVDVGDDSRFGERKVLLDGATPAWGVWTQTPSGERQFEVHKTQQFPGLDDPQEAPLPGDYNLRLASDEASSGLSGRDIFLYVAAGVTVALGFGAIALALLLGRRRPQH